MTFANAARFLDWLAHVGAFNRQHGMRALPPAAVRELRGGHRWGSKAVGSIPSTVIIKHTFMPLTIASVKPTRRHEGLAAEMPARAT
jgi:hypothetical protein